MLRLLLASFVTAATLALVGNTASAASLSCTPAGPGNSSSTFMAGDVVDVQCFDGPTNVSDIDSNFVMFGKTGWTASQNTDASSDTIFGPIQFTTSPAIGGTGGT